jgi:hypothetical protein
MVQMIRTIRCRVIALSAAAVWSITGCAGAAPAPVPSDGAAPAAPPSLAADQARAGGPAQTPKGGEPVNADAKALASFVARLNDYVAMHRKLEDSLPKLKKESTPKEIDDHQRALARLVQNARRGAKPGDIFTPDAQVVIKQLMARVFGGPDGKALRDSINDENPGTPVKLTANTRYPDTVPLSTVPPQVLQGLPKLPEEMEYRFIGDALILMDVHAHLVVDLIEHVLPR